MEYEEVSHLRRYSWFVYGMEYLRVRFPGMSVTSWGRSTHHNHDVGGKPDSQHVEWTAADLVWDPGTRPPTETLRVEAAKIGLELDVEGDHDHVELLRQST